MVLQLVMRCFPKPSRVFEEKISKKDLPNIYLKVRTPIWAIETTATAELSIPPFKREIPRIMLCFQRYTCSQQITTSGDAQEIMWWTTSSVLNRLPFRTAPRISTPFTVRQRICISVQSIWILLISPMWDRYPPKPSQLSAMLWQSADSESARYNLWKTRYYRNDYGYFTIRR